MDSSQLTTVREILQVAADRLIRDLEFLSEVNRSDSSTLFQQGEDLLLTFLG
jgi:hypothetical protein